MPTTLIVDDRERSEVLLECLKRLPECSVIRSRLDVGDILVVGRAILERKTISDLARSIADGRLFRQASRLAASALRPLIVIEGTEGEFRSQGVAPEALRGAIVSLTISFGINVIPVATVEETAEVVGSIIRQLRTHERFTPTRPGKRPRQLGRLQMHILQGLPGVGPAKARRLLSTFGSVEEVICAEVESIAALPGFGMRSALLIRRAVGPLELD